MNPIMPPASPPPHKKDKKKFNVALMSSAGVAVAFHAVLALFIGSVVIFEGKIPANFFSGDFTEGAVEDVQAPPLLMEEEMMPEPDTAEMMTETPVEDITTQAMDTTDLVTASVPTTVPSFTLPQSVGNPNIVSGKIGAARSGGNPGPRLGGGGKVKMNFFGREMLGDNVLFVIDISGSMIFPERGLDGFEKVADEVISTIEQMNENRFNIIGFSKEADSCFDDFVRADRRSIQKAENWLRKMDPQKAVAKGKNSVGPSDFMGYEDNRHLGTRADLALELAFEKRPGLIIFLSDGDPTVTPAPKVLELTEELLKKHEVAINTISYRSKEGQKFLESLAELSGGTYTELK